MPASEPSELRTHIGMKILDQWPARYLPGGQALLGAFAIDGSLDLEQRVNAAHDLDRDWRQRDLFLTGGLTTSVLLDVGHGEERAAGMHPTRRLHDGPRTSPGLIEPVV